MTKAKKKATNAKTKAEEKNKNKKVAKETVAAKAAAKTKNTKAQTKATSSNSKNFKSKTKDSKNTVTSASKTKSNTHKQADKKNNKDKKTSTAKNSNKEKVEDAEVEANLDTEVEQNLEHNAELDIAEEADDRELVIDQKAELKQIIQGILLTASKPLTEKNILSMLDEEDLPSLEDIKNVIRELQSDLENSGIELKRVASGFEMQVRSRYAKYVAKMWEERPPKYSRALFETLALIAYKQPITRGEIEEVRGVAISTSIFKTLLEDRNWIRVVGHRDVPGRPALYATTKQFLDYFNVKGLEDLPSLPEIAKLNAGSEQAKDNLELELEHEVEKQHEAHEQHEMLDKHANGDEDSILDISNDNQELAQEIDQEEATSTINQSSAYEAQDNDSNWENTNKEVLETEVLDSEVVEQEDLATDKTEESDNETQDSYDYDEFSEVVAVVEKEPKANKDSKNKNSKTLADIATKYENLF